jgi:hypothetical protein
MRQKSDLVAQNSIKCANRLIGNAERIEECSLIANSAPLREIEPVVVRLVKKPSGPGLRRSISARSLTKPWPNLFLKYLWCLEVIKTLPPHCPVDRIVIAKTRLREKPNWTDITARAKYEKLSTRSMPSLRKRGSQSPNGNCETIRDGRRYV